MKKIYVLLPMLMVFGMSPFVAGCGSNTESKPNPELGAANTQGPPPRSGALEPAAGKGVNKKP